MVFKSGSTGAYLPNHIRMIWLNTDSEKEKVARIGTGLAGSPVAFGVNCIKYF